MNRIFEAGVHGPSQALIPPLPFEPLEAQGGPPLNHYGPVVRLNPDGRAKLDGAEYANIDDLGKALEQEVENWTAINESGDVKHATNRPSTLWWVDGRTPKTVFDQAMSWVPSAMPARVLVLLTDGIVFLCTGPSTKLPIPSAGRVHHERFEGPHPALPPLRRDEIDPASVKVPRFRSDLQRAPSHFSSRASAIPALA